MKRFIRNLILFMIPVAVAIGLFMVFYVVGIVSGEFYTSDALMAKRIGQSVDVIGLGYNEQTAYEKLLNANARKADVLVLGTSRSMQFKEDYFTTSFYNCGGAVHGNYREYKNYLMNLSYKPKLMVLDLDSWVFNDNWNSAEKDYKEYEAIEPVDRNRIVMAKQILLDWVDGKWTFVSLGNYPDNLGFNGKIKDDGFCEDGSYHYGEVGRDITKSGDYGFSETYERINSGILRFEYGDHVDEDTLVQLEELLDYCRDNNIYVVAYHAPFAPSVYSKMMETGKYGYIGEIAQACEKLFSEYDYEYYDYADVSVIGVSDKYFADGFHGSEVVYAMMVADMTERGSVLWNYVDHNKLQEMIDGKYNEILLNNPD